MGWGPTAESKPEPLCLPNPPPPPPRDVLERLTTTAGAPLGPLSSPSNASRGVYSLLWVPRRGQTLSVSQRPTIPLNPYPLLSPLPRTSVKQLAPVKETNTGGLLTAPPGNFSFSFFTVSFFLLNRCCLMAGCLRRQVSFLALKGGRRGCPGTQGVQESSNRKMRGW